MANPLNNLGHQLSAVTESVLYVRNDRIHRARILGTGALMVAVFLLCTAGAVEAAGTNDLEKYSKNVSSKTNVIVDIISYICYIGGAILAALGIVDLKKHVEQPTQVKMKDGLAKLGFGGMLLALPFFTDVIQDTTGSEAAGNAKFVPFERGQIKIN